MFNHKHLYISHHYISRCSFHCIGLFLFIEAFVQKHRLAWQIQLAFLKALRKKKFFFAHLSKLSDYRFHVLDSDWLVVTHLFKKIQICVNTAEYKFFQLRVNNILLHPSSTPAYRFLKNYRHVCPSY